MNENTPIEEEIKRLKALIRGRQVEYMIFGKTPSDANYDLGLLAKIKELEDNPPN